MARNCAVIVGINDYDEISPLKYAKSDAERMRDFFMQDLGVSHDDLYFFTDDSPRNVQGRKTQPTYGTLKSFLGDRFADPFLSAGDTLWFYFSGHGMPCEGRDYLLPSDGNPRTMPALGIAISDVTERLRRSGADNVVMLIDACRSDGAKNAGMGIGEEKQQGVITFFSCSPSQVSYEIDEIGQGAFTNVLLEALRIQGEGNCATVERFANYLKFRVPRLTQRYKNYAQTPYVVIEPETKLHYILLPKFANSSDIDRLKASAAIAELDGDHAIAFELWMRVNIAASGSDMEAIEAFIRIKSQISPLPIPSIINEVGNMQSTSSKVDSIDSPVELRSVRGIDYRELENLLKAKEWHEADLLTHELMCLVANRKKENWLSEISAKSFPSEDLLTIDFLWKYYSDGKFGFSAQRKIWLEFGGKVGKYDFDIFKGVSSKIFWYQPPKLFFGFFYGGGGLWIDYEEIIQNNKSNNIKASLPAYVFVNESYEKSQPSDPIPTVGMIFFFTTYLTQNFWIGISCVTFYCIYWFFKMRNTRDRLIGVSFVALLSRSELRQVENNRYISGRDS